MHRWREEPQEDKRLLLSLGCGEVGKSSSLRTGIGNEELSPHSLNVLCEVEHKVICSNELKQNKIIGFLALFN